MSAIGIPTSREERKAAKARRKAARRCPAPWVPFTKNPAKWMFFTLQTKLYQVGIAHMGLFAIAGLYFLLLQQEYNIHIGSVHIHVWLKHWWDNLFSWQNWPTIRHLIRDCLEGFLGTLLALMVVINPYKYSADEKLTKVDKFFLKLKLIPTRNAPVTGTQMVVGPLIILLAAIPGFLLGYGVIEGLKFVIHAHSLNPSLSAHPSFIAKLYADDTDAKIVGIFGGLLFGHKAARPVFAAILKFFAQRRVSKGKKDRFWQPIYFRALVRETASRHTAETAATSVGNKSVGFKLMIGVLLIAFLGFAYQGWYVLAHFA